MKKLLQLSLIPLMALTFLLFVSDEPTADASPEPPVSAELMYGKNGDRHYVGLKLTPKEKWHTYWQYPGDAGLPTRLRLSTDATLSLGEIHWPAPIEFSQGGELVGYGYEHDVVLVTELKGGLPQGTLKANWLACNNTLCVPGREKFDLSEAAQGENQFPILEKWMKRVPSTDLKSAGLTVSKVAGNGNAQSISVTSEKPIKTADWYPSPGKELKISQPKEKLKDKELQIVFLAEDTDGNAVDSFEFESVLTVTFEGETEPKSFMLSVKS